MKNHEEITFRGVPIALSYKYNLQDISTDKSIMVAIVAERKGKRASWAFKVNMENQVNVDQAMVDGGIGNIRETFKAIASDKSQLPLIATLLSDEAEDLVMELNKQLQEE